MQAARGFKQAGLSVALNGSGDFEIAPVPPSLGNSGNMLDKLNAELLDSEQQWKAGKLPWCRETPDSIVESNTSHQNEKLVILAMLKDQNEELRNLVCH